MIAAKAQHLQKELPRILAAYDEAGYPQMFEGEIRWDDGTFVKVNFFNGTITAVYVESSVLGTIDNPKIRKQEWHKEFLKAQGELLKKELKLEYKPKGPSVD